ncbi:AMP-binding protein [Caulobacter sp. Root1472]|uniref:AMP-binding protein n=1 Tax=Caulobacter sp. Root1472 TaxID=1736470 RepID=UPI0009E78D8A|nr:AMP-binding protein [Caulobacter sp. Root1472]
MARPSGDLTVSLVFDASAFLTRDGAPREGAPLGALLSAQARLQPDRPAVTLGAETLTFAQLDAAANRRARRLIALGVRPDDTVMIALPNGLAYYETAFAIWKAGASPAHVSHRLTDSEFAALVELMRPRLVIGRGEDAPFDGFEALDPSPLPPMAAQVWRVATSGGSTGRPKLIQDRRPARWTAAMGPMRMRPGAVILNPAPLHHSAPFAQILMTIAQGGHAIEMGRFDAEAWLRLAQAHAVTYAYLVPTMMHRILRLPEALRGAADLSALETVLHMAAPCPAWLKQAWIDWLGPDAIWEVYGGAERMGSCVIGGREWLDHPGSVGRPRPDIGMRITDDAGRELPVGEVGEIWFRTPPEEGPTYAYVGADRRERDGWNSFGDLGRVDQDGYLYLADRRTDMILCGGVNLYPAEIEAEIERHPAVICAVVVGLPDEDLGARPHAIVQSDWPSEPLASELRAALALTLSTNKIPRAFEITTEPLRDAAGKVRRSALAEARR